MKSAVRTRSRSLSLATEQPPNPHRIAVDVQIIPAELRQTIHLACDPGRRATSWSESGLSQSERNAGFDDFLLQVTDPRSGKLGIIIRLRWKDSDMSHPLPKARLVLTRGGGTDL